jgi:hypothetical protein
MILHTFILMLTFIGVSKACGMSKYYLDTQLSILFISNVVSVYIRV